MKRIGQALAIAITTLGLASIGHAAGQPMVPDFHFELKGTKLELTPPIGHHFNAKAPVHIILDGHELKATVTGDRITTVIPAQHQSALVRASAFLCDNANSFCIKKSLQFDLSGSTAQQSSTSETQVSDTGVDPVKPHLELETGFIVNDPVRAFKLAKSKNLPVIIDFFGIWCPPCNHLDAIVFKSDKFKTLTQKRFVRLKLDSDSKVGRDWSEKFKIRGLPTIAFTTSDGQEITRVLGFRPLPEMVTTLNTILAHPNEGFSQLVAKANKGDNEARARAAQILLDRSEYAPAYDMLRPVEALSAAQKKPQQELIYRALLGIAAEKSDPSEARRILNAWLTEFPDSTYTLDNYQQLADLEDEAGNKNASTKAVTGALAEARRLVSHPDLIKYTDNTIADLRETEADLLSQLGEKEKASEAYLTCAEAYLEEASSERSSFARGPNLERAYCLAKAGKLADSEAIFRQGIQLFPTEYTFHHKLSQLLSENYKKPAEALLEAKVALSYAYGNQRLKVVTTLAKTLEELGKPLEAIRAIDQELNAPQLQTITASSLRLRKKLEAQKAALRKNSAIL